MLKIGDISRIRSRSPANITHGNYESNPQPFTDDNKPKRPFGAVKILPFTRCFHSSPNQLLLSQPLRAGGFWSSAPPGALH